MPVIPILIVAGLFGAGFLAKETGEAVDSSTQLVKAGTIAGGLYVAFRVAKSAGAIK